MIIIVQDNKGKAYLSSLDGVRMDVMDPANMQNILDDTEHPFVPAINVPGYNIETIDTSLAANMSYPGSDYTGMIMTGEWWLLISELYPLPARYDGIKRISSGDSLARWSSCCGKPVV